MTTIAELLRDAHGGSRRRDTRGGLRRRDAEVLICAALGVDRTFLYSHPDDQLNPSAATCIERMLDDYNTGIPVAYITGKREFWNLVLEVTPDVLIPRPETELLVELALERLPGNARMLDLGTGSGAIAVAIARQRRDVQITATDISTAALAVAQRNAASYQVDITWAAGNWYELASDTYDLVLSNPPYVSDGDPHLNALVGEPRLALAGGPDGLAALRIVIDGAPAHLAPGGWLLVEHGYDQGEAVRDLFNSARLESIRTVRDLAGHERVTLGRL